MAGHVMFTRSIPEAVMIARSCGHARTETWTATPWHRFESLLSTVVVAA